MKTALTLTALALAAVCTPAISQTNDRGTAATTTGTTTTQQEMNKGVPGVDVDVGRNANGAVDVDRDHNTNVRNAPGMRGADRSANDTSDMNGVNPLRQVGVEELRPTVRARTAESRPRRRSRPCRLPPFLRGTGSGPEAVLTSRAASDTLNGVRIAPRHEHRHRSIATYRLLSSAHLRVSNRLGVEFQEVAHSRDAAHGRLAVEGRVWSVPVVAVQEGVQGCLALC